MVITYVLRTQLNKCDVIYVVSLAYKEGGGSKSHFEYVYFVHAPSLHVSKSAT